MNAFATKESPITIMEFNTMQRTRQRLVCTPNLPSIKKTESIGDVNYKHFCDVRWHCYQRNLTSMKTCGLSFKLSPKEVGRGMGVMDFTKSIKPADEM
jgi:hypothetical protein